MLPLEVNGVVNEAVGVWCIFDACTNVPNEARNWRAMHCWKSQADRAGRGVRKPPSEGSDKADVDAGCLLTSISTFCLRLVLLTFQLNFDPHHFLTPA